MCHLEGHNMDSGEIWSRLKTIGMCVWITYHYLPHPPIVFDVKLV